MSAANRIPGKGRLTPALTARFTIDGRTLTAYEGDTVASAMIANGMHLAGRSFKYHRPRGILTAGPEEPNALLDVSRDAARRQPNVRATVQEVFDGMKIETQNRWPSLKYDIGAVNSLLSPFLSAGFYYKTFMWPKAFWEKLYEPIIRKAAGLGKTPFIADPDRYEKAWAHCDLLVIGSGPAGLMAARAAARAGLRVILADEGFRLGGSLLSERVTVGGVSAAEYAASVVEELKSLSNVTLMPRTTVFGWYDDNVFGAVEKVQKHVAQPSGELPVERVWRIVARRAILASGAEERPLVFGGNDKPGVMTSGAVRTYVNRYGVAAGQNVAIFTNGGAGYRTAADLVAAGVGVAAIIDGRTQSSDVAPSGVRVIRGGSVIDTKGYFRIKGLIAERVGHQEEIACDALAMSGGYSPIVHLACQRGAKAILVGGVSGFPGARCGAGAADCRLCCRSCRACCCSA